MKTEEIEIQILPIRLTNKVLKKDSFEELSAKPANGWEMSTVQGYMTSSYIVRLLSLSKDACATDKAKGISNRKQGMLNINQAL